MHKIAEIAHDDCPQYIPCRRWHHLGSRCECGHLTVPARFYERGKDGKELRQGEAEASYLAWLRSDEKPEYVNPPVMAEIRTEKRTESLRTENDRTKKGRPKKWASEAERLRAYRGRHG